MIHPSAQHDTPPDASFPLPDPLVCTDGTVVTGPAAWWEKRRPELLEGFFSEVYGRTPLCRPEGMGFEMTSVVRGALGGRATLKEVTVKFAAGSGGPAMHLLIYIPESNGKPASTRARRPAFLGLNFYGNHTVHGEPRIALSRAWTPAEAPGVVDNRATEAARGTDTSKWQIESVLARGYATATAYCGDLCPDHPDGLPDGINGWIKNAGAERAGDEWGAIGIWAWGLSRALDYLGTDPDIDAARIAVHGHSRLGKAALWAGAQDRRFALVISNDSGCGGASLSKHVHGETVARINAAFPHWFCRNFRRYDGNEAGLPVDQHELLALVAPRPLYVASASDDAWADPRGEFLAAKAAGTVYRLLGRTGLGLDEMPPLNTSIGDSVRYHIRSGPHDMTAFDWSCYLDFADRWLRPG